MCSGAINVKAANDGTSKSDYTSVSYNISVSETLEGKLSAPKETYSNMTLYFHFVDGENEYKVPDYADAFLGGYYTSGFYTSEHDDWTNPNEVDSKLTAYTYGDATYYGITVDTLYHEGTFYIYFEYTSEETGSDSTLNDWTYVITYDYSIGHYLSDGSSIEIDIAKDPSETIGELSEMPITIALKNSGSSGSYTFHLEGFDNSNWSNWETFSTSSGNGSYDQYITKTMNKNGDFTFWIGGNSYVWKGGLEPSSSCSFEWNATYCYGSMSDDTWKFELSKMASDGSVNWSSVTSLTIILTFNFSSFSNNSSGNNENAIVTSVACIY